MTTVPSNKLITQRRVAFEKLPHAQLLKQFHAFQAARGIRIIYCLLCYLMTQATAKITLITV